LVAPNSNDSKLTRLINELRSKGHNIKIDLMGSSDVDFENINNEWKLKE